jgi:hypothetical protein
MQRRGFRNFWSRRRHRGQSADRRAGGVRHPRPPDRIYPSRKQWRRCPNRAAILSTRLIAAGVGILFSTLLPTVTHLLPAWWGLYGWFFGVAIGGASYWGLRMLPEVESKLARRA